MATIRVQGREDPIEAPAGSSVLSALQGGGAPISTSCGGRGTCGLCRITILEGHETLNPVNDAEVLHLGNVAKLVHLRLACQAIVAEESELDVDVPPVVDVAARKREQARRGAALRRASQIGQPIESPPLEKIEWRPRKLEAGSEKKRRRRRRRKPGPGGQAGGE